MVSISVLCCVIMSDFTVIICNCTLLMSCIIACDRVIHTDYIHDGPIKTTPLCKAYFVVILRRYILLIFSLFDSNYYIIEEYCV